MKIFGDNTPGGKNGFPITQEDRRWVEENFRWLITVFGYPNRKEQQVLLTPQFFPSMFSNPVVRPDEIIDDLCKLFGIPRGIVTHEVLTDLRDFNVPYEIEGKPFECETELRKGSHRIFIAKSLLVHRERLTFSLIHEFIRIRLTESDLEFDVGGDDTGLFIYLAGIYYGFGVILAQNLVLTGRHNDWAGEIKWNYVSDMPQMVMAFSLATYANLTGDPDPAWKKELAPDFRKLFDDAISFLHANPNDLYDEREVKANDLFNQANDFFDQNDLESAISTLQKILFVSSDDIMKADVYNNMGYYYMRKKDYQQAISNFYKALNLGPEYGFANDNLGYALILTGDLEEGKSYLEKAIKTGNNDVAYSYRNMALYHQRKGNFVLAEDFYQEAFSQEADVDLLAFHYGEFLLEQGEIERARSYFAQSAARKEEDGIRKLAELEGTTS
jgi:tetratricopeptide (TPR) repeat protein